MQRWRRGSNRDRGDWEERRQIRGKEVGEGIGVR